MRTFRIVQAAFAISLACFVLSSGNAFSAGGHGGGGHAGGGHAGGGHAGGGHAGGMSSGHMGGGHAGGFSGGHPAHSGGGGFSGGGMHSAPSIRTHAAPSISHSQHVSPSITHSRVTPSITHQPVPRDSTPQHVTPNHVRSSPSITLPHTPAHQGNHVGSTPAHVTAKPTLPGHTTHSGKAGSTTVHHPAIPGGTSGSVAHKVYPTPSITVPGKGTATHAGTNGHTTHSVPAHPGHSNNLVIGGKNPGHHVTHPGGTNHVVSGNTPGKHVPVSAVISSPGHNNPHRPGGINISQPGSGLHVGGGNSAHHHHGGNQPGGNLPGGHHPGWGLPGNGYGHHQPWNNNQWRNTWYNHCVNGHYHNWYRGSWYGSWGSSWYSPNIWGPYGWGAGGWWTGGSWGYGPRYYNPYYYSTPGVYCYNYSQPVIVTNYLATVPSTTTQIQVAAAQPAPQTTAQQQALALFDNGLAAFKTGDYASSLKNFDDALQLLPNDAVLHEVRALNLFALGKYQESAAALNALLATSPGMDWASMAALYGNDATVYTEQLRKLEAQVKSNPDDAAAQFLIAYHYLVIGENGPATRALQNVVELQPKDATAWQLLKAITPEPTKPESAAPVAPVAPDATSVPDEPATNLVGNWIAKNAEVTVELSVAADNNFTWKATPTGKEPVEVKGTLAADDDSLALESPQQGTMVGSVKSAGDDQFTFTMANSDDEGLVFKRVK